MRKYCAIVGTRLLWSVSFAAVIAVIALPVFGRDLDGRYKTSPLHDWFEHLASRKGLCCSFADGYVVNCILDAAYRSSETKRWEQVEYD